MRYYLAILFILLLVGMVSLLSGPRPIGAQPFLTQPTGGGGPPFLTDPGGGPPFGTQPPGGGPPFATQPPAATAFPTGVAASLTPTVLAPGCETTFPIETGASVTVRPGINIRSSPSVSAPLVANFPENRVYTVLDGPECGDNYIWWQISGGGIRGWVAERNTQLDFIRFFSEAPGATEVCRTPLTISAGEEVELTTGVRIRTEPTLDGLVLTVAPLGAVATVLQAEQVCGDGYNWLRVSVTVAGFTYEGWMVEAARAEDDILFIEPTESAEPCSIPRSIAIGSTGRVDYRDNQPKNLRAAPSYNGEILYTLVNGVPLVVRGGPVCSGGMNWWFVDILASFPVSGWIAEGPRPNYWFSITNDVGGQFDTVTPGPTVPTASTLTPSATLLPTVTPTPQP